MLTQINSTEECERANSYPTIRLFTVNDDNPGRAFNNGVRPIVLSKTSSIDLLNDTAPNRLSALYSASCPAVPLVQLSIFQADLLYCGVSQPCACMQARVLVSLGAYYTGSVTPAHRLI